MTDKETGPTNSQELNEELKSLLRQAHDNGIGIDGGWECRNGPEHPDWDVLITEVTKTEQTDD